MNESSVLTIDTIIKRCLTKNFGQSEVVKTLISDSSYRECWEGLVRWLKSELDLGHAVKIPGLGRVSKQTFQEELIVFLDFHDDFLDEAGLAAQPVEIREVRYPTILLSFQKVSKATGLDKDLLTRAIQAILLEIEDIFRSFDNFEMALGPLGKFFVDDKVLRYLPWTRPRKKKAMKKKLTVKNMIEIHMKKQEANSRKIQQKNSSQLRNSGLDNSQYSRKRFRSNLSGGLRPQGSRSQIGSDQNLEMSEKGSALYNSRQGSQANFGEDQAIQQEGSQQLEDIQQSAEDMVEDLPPIQNLSGMALSQRSAAHTIFSQSNNFKPPMRRIVQPPDEEVLMNEMFGAGTDPKALNQNFSVMAADAKTLMTSNFQKPPFAKIRCPPVIDHFCRTMAAPIASLYNSLSASSRIALLYSIATKYLYFDEESKGIAYLKIKENQTKLIANNELLKDLATEEEEQEYLKDPEASPGLKTKILAKQACFERYQQYIYEEIPGHIIAPIRQYWIINILKLIPASYQELDQRRTEDIIDETLNEINEDYYIAVKKSIVDYILREDSEKLRIGILQRFDPPDEYGEGLYRGIVIDQEWVENISGAREAIEENLVSYCQATLSIINIWAPIEQDSFFDLPAQYDDQLLLSAFLNRQKDKKEMINGRIQENWINEVGNIYKKDTEGMDNIMKEKYFNASGGLMNCQLRELIYKSVNHFKDFVLSCKQSEYPDVAACMASDINPSATLETSFLKLVVQEDGKKIMLSDTKDGIISDFEELIDEIVYVCNKLPLPKIDVLQQATKKFYWKIELDNDEVIQDAKSSMREVLEGSLTKVEEMVSIFSEFEYLVAQKEAIKTKIESQIHKVSYSAMIEKYTALITEIEEKIPFEVSMCLVLVDCKEIRARLIDNCRFFINTIQSKIFTHMNQLRQSLQEEISLILDELHKNATNPSQLEAIQNKIESIEKEEKGVAERKFTEVLDWLKMLYQYDFSIKQTSLDSVNNTATQLKEIENKLSRAKEHMEKDKKTIQMTLQKEIEIFEDNLLDLEEQILKMQSMNDDDVLTTILKIQQQIKEYNEMKVELNAKEDKVGFKPSKFKKLEQAEKEIEPFAKVYFLADEWKGLIEMLMRGKNVFDLHAEDVLKDTKKKMTIVTSAMVQFESMKKLDNAYNMAMDLQKDIKAFQSLGKLITSLSSQGMVERHWRKVNDICRKQGINNMEWSVNSNYTLQDAQEAGMAMVEDNLVDIATQANRELVNHNILKSMGEEWREVEIKLKVWKETKTYVIQGECVDELQTLLDDHIIKTQTMKGSASAKVHEASILGWEKDLLYFRDTLEDWLKVQSNWLYLQPIFLSPDIKREMPESAEDFQGVDRKWRELMARTLKQPLALQIPKEESLHGELLSMLSILEEVQSNLTQYLNRKRAEFPRFYFLSEDSLIEVLSEARNPRKIQKFAKILFEGIKLFNFDEEDRILGVTSSEGEVIVFEEMIETRPHQGLVEKWLRIFNDSCKVEVRKFIEHAFEDFDQMEREDFVLDRPAQAVLNVDMTRWTFDTERAIRDGGVEGLSSYTALLTKQLNRIVELVKQPISKLNRRTLESLIVLDVHNRVVVNQLIESEVSSITDFDYEAQLRYYFEPKEDSTDPQNYTVVKIINSVLEYSYEYLGNSSRLVITPLTDRCYRTLCGAIGLFYGGAPEGPAGTGKTETVKDLAKALSRMIVVFNCSENLKFMDMARFFKGLASTGGWSCFDEFNRIKLEVLSVIAQQLQCIQNAIREDADTFEFMGSSIKLVNTCNCFITMNPGYAGRSDLPDNLKALFRAVAMMVPDYALIAEIRLYSFGFTEAQVLSKKIVTTYKLSSEQISAQKHYDYGMRAVQSVLKAAGNLRKAQPEAKEDELVLQAINEVNEAKFLALDLPLFKDITNDLFPSVEIPNPDFENLYACIYEVLNTRKLLPEPYFMKKIIELYQMILVRHGLMVVGEAYCGKSTCISVLAEALGLMEDRGHGEHRVTTAVINPKSLTNPQLYGITDIATGEWSDGVLPVKFKTLANDPSPNRKWMWFDGPVDAIWIEDMNTVLDDNKKLCLANGDIFYMSDTMNLIFEPMNLLVASPATVSRCGMVFMEPYMMGWYHLYKAWKLRLPAHFDEKFKEDMDIFFLTVLTPMIGYFEAGEFELTAPAMSQNLVYTMLQLADHYLGHFQEKKFYNSFDHKQRLRIVDQMLAYCIAWSAGATVTNKDRQRFDNKLRKLCTSADSSIDEEMKRKHRGVSLPDQKVFEYLLEVKKEDDLNDPEKYEVRLFWVSWEEQLDANSTFPKNMQASEIIVETVDSVRYGYLMQLYLSMERNMLVCGPTGTGKTVYIKRLVGSLPKKDYAPLEIGFSAQTTAKQVQTIIDSALSRGKVKGTFVPPAGKKMVLFIDDLNMPKKGLYGAQPPIELLRQMIDNGGWYDNVEKSRPFRTLNDIIFMGAMGPPSGGRNQITPRFQRHLHFLSFTELDDKQMVAIFTKIINWKFSTDEFNSRVVDTGNEIIKATLKTYNTVCENFLPTPQKSHYLFNLRDFAKVIIGFCLCEPETVEERDSAIRLWIHEVWRVFSDRLNSEQDRLDLLDHLKDITSKTFKGKFDVFLADMDNNGDGMVTTLAEMRGLIFSDVLTSPQVKKRPYQQVTDQEALYKACNTARDQYNQDLDDRKPLNIVLFNFAIEHLLTISRLLKLPGANALLVGVGGSGRKSLTILASHMADNKLKQIELTKNYGIEEWKTDLKELLKSSGKGDKSVFLFSDTQIKQESFIEDVNNLLNNGEVPNLFEADERGELLESARKLAKLEGREGVETTDQLLAFFTETVKKHLHVVLCFSPIGDTFRQRIRMFPSLVNCCTIDWFFEWPEEALLSVAQSFLEESPIDDSIKVKCVEMIQHFHKDTTIWSQKFYDKLKRNYYVTPTSYIEMIGQFKQLLAEKTEEITLEYEKYKNGYQMIIDAEIIVSQKQVEITEMVPQIKAASEETQIKLERTEKASKEVAIVKENMAGEEAIANEKAEKASIISASCQAAMDEVQPKIDAATERVGAIKPSDFNDIKNAPQVTLVLQVVFQALIYIMEPEKHLWVNEYNAETMKTEPNYWKTFKKMMMKLTKLIDDMKGFQGKHGAIKGSTYKKIETLFSSDAAKDFNLLDSKVGQETVQHSNQPAAEIYGWIIAQYEYYPVYLEVKPKMEALAIANADKEQALAELAVKQAGLKKVVDELAKLNKELKEAQERTKMLKDEYEKCKLQLQRAKLLITNLSEEKGRWKDISEIKKLDLGNIIGDVLISAGLMSYCGPFTASFRSEIIENWAKLSQSKEIPGSEVYSFVKTLGKPVDIRAWQIYGLPSDNFSTENAIILKKARRWALCIDPQLQANKWIKNMEKSNNLMVTKMDGKYMKQAEVAIQRGAPFLIENIGEELDASLNPILLKQVKESGGIKQIKIGENDIDYDENFTFYITTKLRNPHYLPEVSTKVTIINFMITMEGLADQLLATVVSKELPEQEKIKNELIEEGAANKKELERLEAEILGILNQDKNKLLEDAEAINLLTSAKTTSNDINLKQEESKKTEAKIDAARKNYVGVSKEGSCMFFVISDLVNIEPMYQYSLTYFLDLFVGAILNSEKSDDIEVRLFNIKKRFLLSLYKNVSQSLFVKDKLLFSFLLCSRLKQFEGALDPRYFDFLLTGTIGKLEVVAPQPEGLSWMKEKAWIDINSLQQFGGEFEGLIASMSIDSEIWNGIYDCENPVNEKFPEKLEENLNDFQKILIMRSLRYEKIVPMIQKYVIDNMGLEFVETGGFSLETVYKESSCITPLVFVLTSGADPFKNLQIFADLEGKRLDAISLGQGQGEAAIRLIDNACANGSWVILQNCHLAESFMPILEEKCDQLVENASEIKSEFRLWLTSKPSNLFPASILQNGIKMTNEPPSGLKTNLKTAFQLDEISNPNTFNKSLNIKAYRRLVFSLCFFHSVIQERRKFGPLGWNIPYEFTESDLRISSMQLHIFIDKYPEDVPLEALRYLTAQCNYGGRVTDKKDRRLITTLLLDFYNEDAYSLPQFELAPGHDEYFIPNGVTYDDFLNCIDELPLISHPGIYGFHANAAITKEIGETTKMLDTLLLCQGGSGGGSGDESSKAVNIIDNILEDFPDCFNLKAARKAYPIIREDSMNTILIQEVARFNKLIEVIARSLENIKKGLKGEIIFSVELELALNNILINKVPKTWMDLSYPSLKPLSSYIKDLMARVIYFGNWIENGKPKEYWLPGFFFAQGFLTGVQQNYARKYTIAIDKLIFDFEALPEDFDPEEAAEDGAYVYGLFLQGAKFNFDSMLLDESDNKILFTKAPKIFFKPVKTEDETDFPHYECPLYITSERRGELLTTGHSTNFVMSIKIPSDLDECHWIKRGVAALNQLDD